MIWECWQQLPIVYQQRSQTGGQHSWLYQGASGSYLSLEIQYMYSDILLTHSLTPWSRVLLEKLNGSQLVKKFPAFYGTRRSIAALQEPATCPCSEPDQSTPFSPSHFLKIRFNIILPSAPGSHKWSFFLTCFHQHPLCTSLLPRTYYMPRPSHSILFDRPNNIWWGVQIVELLIM